MQFDKEKYKIWTLSHPLILHWFLNPGIAINELAFGQRQPKVTLIDKTSNAPLMERTYIPCEHCGALNDGRLWGKGNAFGHWYGFVCPECGGRIDCIWNLFSLIILGLTFPIWLPLKKIFEDKWYQRQKDRIEKMKNGPIITSKTVNWLKMGLLYGLIMFCLMTPMLMIIHPEGQMTLRNVLVQALIWLGAGLGFGGIMKLLVGTKRIRRIHKDGDHR